MTKREKIIEIFEKWQDYVIDPDVYNEVADTILALDEQKENKTAEEILREHPDAPIISTSPTRRMLINDIIDAMKEYRQQPQKVEQEVAKDQYGYPLTTANNQTEVRQEEEKPTDEDIVASIPYPNPISIHQSDINIGWIRCMKAMRDNPEQFRDK